ncbi:MAG TPA: hypothetical protein VGX22_11690, partial [Candidatus Dormibacteraeota bacterium]|nr:hypothetical protein [Candidatus Dormibacteraeota bacterium]
MKRKLLLCAMSALIALGGALATPAAGFAKTEEARTNVVIDWNQTMLQTLAAAGVPAPPAVRYAAIVEASVFDAVNGIDRRYTSIHVEPAAPRGASRQAAAAAAAYTALVSLFPAQIASLDAARAASMASLGGGDDSQSIARGVQWGTTVADQIVAWRSTDGFSTALGPYPIVNLPGHWQPTPPAFSTNPVFRTLAITAPVAMTSPSEFRP